MSDERGDTSLPAGLTIRKRGESIETVTTEGAEVSLLATGDGAEVISGCLRQGEHITLLSSGGAFETYVLLSGGLRSAVGGGVLEPGDTVVTAGLTEPVLFEAVADTAFLCFTTQPTFYEVSQDHRDMMRLAEEIEEADGYTSGHSRRLRSLANAVGRRLGLPPARLHLLNYAAHFHDVGKTRVPPEMLRKPGPLDEKEWSLMRQHPIFGRDLLTATFMREAGPIVEQHHERIDGSGYPYGLKGDAILIEALIIAVVDTFDSLTTDRPYRPGVSPAAARAELLRARGTLLPAAVVDAFLEVLEHGSKAPEAK